MTALLILFLTAIAVLFAGLTKRSLLQPLSLFGTLLALGATGYDLFGPGFGWGMEYASMFRFMPFAHAFSGVAILATVLIIALSGWGFRNLNSTLGDHYGLILFSLTGALILFSFTNLTMLFLGIEILSIPLYVLAGSRRDDLSSNEAALKYFLMGSFATGILLFGMALIYGATASFDLGTISRVIGNGDQMPGMLKVGILIMIMGLSFKVSAVPFHFWAPDVYQGSPNLITAFMATVVKTAGFAAFYRLFAIAFPGAEGFWSVPVALVAALTMTVANITAIFQQDFKRMMAYSSISHAGYLLLAVLAIGTEGADRALLFYTLTYSLATICAFGAFIIVAEQTGNSSFEAFNGLGKKQPLVAAVLTLSMLSLAGIPPLAGFFGKYFLFTAAFAKYPWLIVLAVINSAISIYYYFKIIIAMYFNREDSQEATLEIPAGVRLAVLVGLALIAWLTLAPGSVYGLI
ncbi:MAG: NADH-quinone oxidoreductase subunit N [Chitinophagales bacterium]|nr:NADH-quinone oxidoreductase subunit N [Chitinophagales bacterium]